MSGVGVPAEPCSVLFRVHEATLHAGDCLLEGSPGSAGLRVLCEGLAEMAKALQAAFNAMVRDPDFLADAARMRVDVSPLDSAQMLERVEQLAQAPPEALDYFRKLHERAKAGD